MNLKKIVDETLTRLNGQSATADFFLKAPSDIPRYAIGKNDQTTQLNKLVTLHGVIDDFTTEMSFWKGIPIVKTQDVPLDALIANCSTSISPVAVLSHLRHHGFYHIVGLHQLIIASKGKMDWPSFVTTMKADFKEHPEAWEHIYDSFADEESRATFLDIIRFRLSCDPYYMKSYTVRIDEQYFEDFMQFKNEVFVDAGGFDGDTSEGFAKRYPDYKKIILFEPSELNISDAHQRLSGYRDIEYHSIGLSDSAGFLGFNQENGSASNITDSANSRIKVDTLDNTVLEPVTFIKMDLEGWEIKALQGSFNHISQSHPKLAIAVYHDSPDFRLIHKFIEGFGINYKCYLRHYTQGWSESIMFFIKN